MTGVTQILASIERGDPHAAEQLLPLVYEELRKLAAARMAQERADHTLQATALVHEAYVRLVDGNGPQHWDSRVGAFSCGTGQRSPVAARPQHGPKWATTCPTGGISCR